MPRLKEPRRPTSTAPDEPAYDEPVAHPGDSLCGYRVVRKLGGGKRADVLLGFGEIDPDATGASTAVLKVYRPETATASILAELAALGAAQHPHIVRLIDVATAPSGKPCLVLERLARGSLAHLLEVRSGLGAGEAVTILAPIAVAVDAMHASGVTHGAIGARAVLFRESGAPVLAAFGSASAGEPNRSAASLGTDEAVRRDRTDLGALAHLVAARAGLDPSFIPDPGVDRFGEELTARLFAIADAAAVRFADDAPPRSSTLPSRVGATHRDSQRDAQSAAQAQPREGPSGGVGIDAARARELFAVVVAHARTVRRPVWVAAATVVVALVAALALVPANERATAEPDETVPVTTSVPERGPDDSIAADDPVAALDALLTARALCFEAISVLCLDGVDQASSQAFDTDAAQITELQNGGEIQDAMAIVPGEVTVVERLGDTVLLDLGTDSKPASALIIKGEAGWRIRDYLDG